MSEEEKTEIVEEEPGEVSEEEAEEGLEKDDKEETPEETPRFELKKVEPIEPEVAEDLTEIIHNGQPYKFTKEKMVELAQKGFDYDVKVGPHGKLVQMVDADPGLAKTINDYWQGKVSGPSEPEPFTIKPITDYENESEWLQDNIQTAFKTFQPPAPFIPPQPQPPTNVASDALKMRDPEHALTIIPKMGEYVAQLSVADYQRVDSDMAALCQFYDFVKGRELAKRTVSPRVTPMPGLRVKSGGGDAPKADSKNAWDLSKDEFQSQLNKVKGYG